ncbi:hypothetical protein ABE10_25335, partial [Bacillus toyonensis]|nr:hypothetical protein [Bacillus toyonensis]
DLIHDLRDHRVDLARHDARSRLLSRKVDLAEPGLRARGQQPQVVADLRQLDRVALEGRGKGHERAGVTRGLDEVGRRDEIQPRDRPQMAQDRRGVAGMGGDAGADRRRPHVDLEQERGVLGQTGVIVAEGRGEAVELLAKGHRNRILQLGPSYLEHVVELIRLAEERATEKVELVQHRTEREREADLDRGRVDVVGRLAAVGVVDRREVSVVPLGAPRHLESDVGDDLVGVHVGRGAGPALDHADDELVVELAVDHPLRGRVDEVCALGVENPDLLVRPGACLLDHGQASHQVGIDRDRTLRDREVLLGAKRVHPPVRVGGNLLAPQGVGLGTSQGRRIGGHGHILVGGGEQ